MATASPADVEYLQAMLEHHQEAVTMSQDYLSKSSAGRLAVVGDLARGVITAQTAEIKQMGGWLKAAGAPLASPNPTEPSDPGMGKGGGGMDMMAMMKDMMAIMMKNMDPKMQTMMKDMMAKMDAGKGGAASGAGDKGMSH